MKNKTTKNQNQKVIFSDGIDLLCEKKPDFKKEIENYIQKNFNIKDSQIIECDSFFTEEPYYIQKVDGIIYVYFWAEH